MKARRYTRTRFLLLGAIATAALAVPLIGQARELGSNPRPAPGWAQSAPESGQTDVTRSDTVRTRLRMAPIARVDPCWTMQRAAFPVQPQYNVGPAFAGLHNSYRARLCAPDPRLHYDGKLMPGDRGTNTVPYFLNVYGTCRAISEEGCAPPLAIETWPICADNLSSSSATGGFDQRGARVSSLQSLLLRERGWLGRQTGTRSAVLGRTSGRLHPTDVAGLLNTLRPLTRSIPVSLSTDGTSLLKLYAGATTTEIYTRSPELAARVGAAIALRELVTPSGQKRAARSSGAYGAGCGAATGATSRHFLAPQTNFSLVKRVGLTSGYTHHSRCARTSNDVIDPINVVWYGPSGGPHGVSVQSINQILSYIGYDWDDDRGPFADHQYVLTWPAFQCEREGAQAATLCSTCERDHMRLFATFITGYGDPYHVVADVHHDHSVICGGINAHAATFLDAKRRLVATWIARVNPYKSGIFWRRWDNRQPIRQCNGWMSADNGWVAFL